MLARPHLQPVVDLLPADEAAQRRDLARRIDAQLADALDMKAVLDLQWACISLASISAAAGSDDFLDVDEFDDTFRDSRMFHFGEQSA